MLNRSINEGKWPQLWKKGEWVPVFKCDDPLLKENYRPITVLPVAGKVFEQIVAKHSEHVAVMAERRSRYGSGKLLFAVLALCLYAITYRKNEVRADFQVIGLFSTFYSKHFCSARPQLHGRDNSYLKSRVLHTANGTSSFQFDRIALCGDVPPQPGPAVKVKYPSKECRRNVRSNRNAILYANCETWSHARCLGFTNTQFKHYLDNSHIDWICNWCCLPFCKHSDLGFNAESNISNDFEISVIIQDQEGEYANILPTDGQRPHNKACCHENNSSIIDLRKENSSNALLMHLNINSIQNKFEDLTILNRSLKAQILVISQTKIDRSYPDSQFKLQGYNMFHKDRAKGEGGLLVYTSTTIPSRKLTLPTTYKTLEAIAVDVKIGRQDILILSIYRPPNSSKKESKTCGNYLERVESELNSICQWACFKKKTVIIVGGLNLDRLRLDRSEGKILRDLEEVNDLHCLINEPTRVTANSQTLIDVMLTNNSDLFKNCGVYNLEISDHSMIYGEMTEKVKKHTTKTLVHRQTKTTDFDNFNKDLLDAPWHVGEIFDDLDDAYDY